MESSNTIPTLYFNPSASTWQPVGFKEEATELKDITHLTFITYNVWFDKHNFNARGRALFQIMEESNADFICLQEVIDPFYKDLLSSKWAQKYYISGNRVDGYVTLILSKHPCNFFFQNWISGMGRYLIYAELKVNGKKTAIATVHLESLGNPDFRRDQLNLTYKQLKDHEIVAIMGDFNFDNATENQNISKDYVDLWRSIYPEDPGFTMKRVSNFLAWRPDRVILKRNKLCQGISIERIGTEPLAGYKNGELKKREPDEIITPSDHFGLKAVISFKPEDIKVEGQHEQKLYGTIISVLHDMSFDVEKHAKSQEDIKKLEKAAEKQHRHYKHFYKAADSLEYIGFMMHAMDDLVLVVDYLSLFTILGDWRMYFRQILYKYGMEKSSKFQLAIIVDAIGDSKELCAPRRLENYQEFTSFEDLIKGLPKAN